MTAGQVSLGRLWALMLTVFVDMVGFLIVVPLLPFYADRLGASAFLVGLMISAFALAQLVTSPTWGRLSDHHGRRPVIQVGIVISALAHTLFAFASSDWALERYGARELLALLFLSRLIQGAGGATTGVVQAYVGDAIVPEERAKALGWISAATSAGVMIGPAVGSLAALAGPAVPGLVAASLCALNLAFARRFLPESASDEARSEAASRPRGGLRRRLLEISTHPRLPVPRLIWIYAAGMMAFMAMNAMLALYLQARFGFTEKSIGYLYTYIGTISLVMRSLLLGPAIRWLGEIGALRLGLLSLCAGFALQPIAPSVAAFVAVLVLVPVGTALLFPATSSLVSQFSARSELGATMGVQQAYGGVARLVGPIWAGAAFSLLGPGSPFWISGAIVAATLVFSLGLEPPGVVRAVAEGESSQPAG